MMNQPVSPALGPPPPRSEVEPPAGSSLALLAWRPVAAVAAVVVAIELAMSARYGIHRDELYFLACSRHLAWGYVDQPPLVPAVARLMTALFGPSVVALRALPAVAAGGTVVVSAALARELGGSRRSQLLAAVAAATSAQALAIFHLLSTAAFDTFFWSVITLIVVRLCRTRDPRWWLAVGAVGGVAGLNKLNVAFLLLAVVGGVALTAERRLLLNRWLLLGALVGLTIFSPDLDWNWTHDWAQLTMIRSLHRENSTIGASLGFIPSQLIVVGPVLAFVWIPGLRRLLRHSWGRPLALAYLLLLGWFTLTGGKSYYLAGMYYVLFAAGAVAIEERLGADPIGGARRLRRWLVVPVIAGLVALPLALPVLPESTLPKGPWEGNMNKDLSATIGWRSLVSQVAAVADRLPPAQRARLVVFTGDYGAAGAIDLYRGQFGLPHAVSGHNNYWWWGPGPAPGDSTTIAIDLPRGYLQTIFGRVLPAGVVQTPGGAWTEERGDSIWVCDHQLVSWRQAWPGARHYG